MEDPVLNRNLEDIKELQTRWNQFHDFIIMAMQQGAAKITPQAELKFLELKSRIAMLHDSFMGGVKHEAKTAQNIIQIVADAILLKKSAGASPAERQKFEFDWNECFMLLNDTVSSMDEEVKRLAGINERAYHRAQRAELMKAKFHNFLRHPALKWSIGLLVVLFVIFGVPATNLYDYRDLYRKPPIPQTKPVYQKFVHYLYRPYINKELEFCDMDEVVTNDNADKFGATPKDARTPTIDANQFKNTILAELGASGNLAELQSMFNKRKETQFRVEQMNLGGTLSFLSLMLDKTDDAKKFIDMLNADLAKSPNKTTIIGRSYLMRKANLLVFGIGNHALHEGYVKDKWKPYDQNNQLK